MPYSGGDYKDDLGTKLRHTCKIYFPTPQQSPIKKHCYPLQALPIMNAKVTNIEITLYAIGMMSNFLGTRDCD